MNRIRPISKVPEHAATITPEVKITFIISILQASLPLFRNKDPQGPLVPDTPADDPNNNE